MCSTSCFHRTPLPGGCSPRLDRGRFARPIEHWRTLFTEFLHEEHFQPYAFGLPFLPLWQMVYFVGVPR